jgi:hypothetical protein
MLPNNYEPACLEASLSELHLFVPLQYLLVWKNASLPHFSSSPWQDPA